MTATPLDLDAYRRRIGFDDALAPTLATLARLIERHAATIAFENVEVLAGRVPDLGLEALERKMVRSPRGGYCYEQNTLFHAVLRTIGFDVAALEARVRHGVPADVVTGRTHMALQVRIDGVDYLADVGFGGLAPTTPVRLDDPTPTADRVGAYRIVATDDDRLLQLVHGGESTDCYRIVASRPEHRDHELGNWFVATNPGSMLGRNLLAGIATPAGRLTLFNRKLTLRTRSGTEETMLHSRADFARVLADDFRLALADADLDALMRAVGRHDTELRPGL
jgi:N-hydroxyarylamine O-acetyltransferase